MSGYDIYLSDGVLLTTVNVKTVDQQINSSLFLIGQGIPDYGTNIAQDFVWLLENFAKASSPIHPLVGQEWYDKSHHRMNAYDGTNWHYYIGDNSSDAILFDMDQSSQNVDFTVVSTVPVFTGADSNKKYCPSRIILIPRGTFTATVPPTINFSVNAAGDVLASQSLPIISSTHCKIFTTGNQPSMIIGTQTLNLNITTAASGGQLNYDIYVYGAIF
jgi:hypothetical protein